MSHPLPALYDQKLVHERGIPSNLPSLKFDCPAIYLDLGRFDLLALLLTCISLWVCLQFLAVFSAIRQGLTISSSIRALAQGLEHPRVPMRANLDTWQLHVSIRPSTVGAHFPSMPLPHVHYENGTDRRTSALVWTQLIPPLHDDIVYAICEDEDQGSASRALLVFMTHTRLSTCML